MQRVALAQHQNGLVLLRERRLAVDASQHQGLVWILVPDDRQAQVGHALCLDVHLSERKKGDLYHAGTFSGTFSGRFIILKPYI